MLSQRTLAIFPNPSAGLVNVRIPANLSTTDLHVYNAEGRLMDLQEVTMGTDLFSFSVDGPDGLYQIRLQTADGLYQGRWIKSAP